MAGPTVSFPAAEHCHSPSAGTHFPSRWRWEAELAWLVDVEYKNMQIYMYILVSWAYLQFEKGAASFSPPGLFLAWRRAIRYVPLLLSFFLTSPLETMSEWTGPIFTKFSGQVSMIDPTFCDRSRDVAMLTDCLARITLYSMRWHFAADRRIATWIRALTPSMTSLRRI